MKQKIELSKYSVIVKKCRVSKDKVHLLLSLMKLGGGGLSLLKIAITGKAMKWAKDLGKKGRIIQAEGGYVEGKFILNNFTVLTGWTDKKTNKSSTQQVRYSLEQITKLSNKSK